MSERVKLNHRGRRKNINKKNAQKLTDRGSFPLNTNTSVSFFCQLDSSFQEKPGHCLSEQRFEFQLALSVSLNLGPFAGSDDWCPVENKEVSKFYQDSSSRSLGQGDNLQFFLKTKLYPPKGYALHTQGGPIV